MAQKRNRPRGGGGRPPAETLPQAVTRMQREGWSQAQIQGQVRHWHPGWTSQRVAGAVPTPKTNNIAINKPPPPAVPTQPAPTISIRRSDVLDQPQKPANARTPAQNRRIYQGTVSKVRSGKMTEAQGGAHLKKLGFPDSKNPYVPSGGVNVPKLVSKLPIVAVP